MGGRLPGRGQRPQRPDQVRPADRRALRRGRGPHGRTTPLKIEFVNVKDSQIRGTIAPYTDPTCSCQVETTFLGNRTGESIEGKFETKLGGTGKTQAGSWQVKRTEH
ncbi:MAG TPA: hypothetical protein VGC42_27480 [Kofleriaceae bacterium]